MPPTNSLQFLPFDLVAEILCRFPVKHLIQLCYVCKSWNSLISHDSEFTKKHLSLSTSNLVLSSIHSSRELLVSDSSISSIFSTASTTSFTQLNHLYEYGRVTTCDGMLCVRIDQSSSLLFSPSIINLRYCLQ